MYIQDLLRAKKNIVTGREYGVTEVSRRVQRVPIKIGKARTRSCQLHHGGGIRKEVKL